MPLSSEKTAIETPIVTYRHRDRKNRVSLVGMIHIAQPAYYESIQEFVDTRAAEGAFVHYERVKNMSPAVTQRLGPDLRRRIGLLKGLANSPYALFEGMNVVRQRDALVCREEWQNHDALVAGVACRLSFGRLAVFNAAVGVAKGVFSRLSDDQRLMVVKGSLEKILDSSPEYVASRAAGKVGRVILGYRNDIALNAFDGQQSTHPGSDVVLVWGAGHVPGLGAGLEARGYEKTGVQMMTAIDLGTLDYIAPISQPSRT